MRPNLHLEKETQADQDEDSDANISKIAMNGTARPFGTVPIRTTNREELAVLKNSPRIVKWLEIKLHIPIVGILIM